MNELFQQPHTVKVTHPSKARDAKSNVGSLTYTSPPATQENVRGMMQFRGGSRAVLDEGAAYPIDAILYTASSAVAVDDMVEPETPAAFASYKFIVTSVMPKTDVDGVVRHYQCSLTRSKV